MYVGIFILNKNFFLMYIELSFNQHAFSNCMMFICLFSPVANKECDICLSVVDDEVCSMMNQLILDNVFHVKSVVVVVVLKRRPLCLGTIIERKRVLVPDGCLPTSANDLAKIR